MNDDDIPRIGPDEPIKSAANELEAAHQLLDGRPGVIPRDQARDLATRIHSLTRSSSTKADSSVSCFKNLYVSLPARLAARDA